MDAAAVLENVRELSTSFAADRHDRQRRRDLDSADFEALKSAGLLLTGVPATAGGLFESVSRSTRSIGEILYTLGRADSSVALVSSMHPAVLSLWNATPTVPPPDDETWRAQSRRLAEEAASGCWFGTITSEPGSGGDIARTAAVARPGPNDRWSISGQKHFGSGSGQTSLMLTTARPEHESDPDWFLLDMREVPWDGTHGVELTARWDGHGMTATQSHGMLFTDYPATRCAWPGHWRDLSDAASAFITSMFTSVVLGIVEAAIDEARGLLRGRADSLRAYEQVEWANAEQDAWLARQAHEGLLRAAESEHPSARELLLGKTSVARLAEDCLRRLARIMGGGTLARHSPFGFWFEDVRALGFLRPPWGLAYDGLIASAWDDRTG